MTRRSLPRHALLGLLVGLSGAAPLAEAAVALTGFGFLEAHSWQDTCPILIDIVATLAGTDNGFGSWSFVVRAENLDPNWYLQPPEECFRAPFARDYVFDDFDPNTGGCDDVHGHLISPPVVPSYSWTLCLGPTSNAGPGTVQFVPMFLCYCDDLHTWAAGRMNIVRTQA